jgi:DNA (cytosine-5)-methyltransferase 1
MKALDLFCGAAGGWSLGLHRAGIETVAACEIDPWRRSAYAKNNPGVRLYDDVRTLTAQRLHADGIASVDILVGSPPCQDASSANAKGKGVDGERTGLFFEALRLVRELRPLWVCLENVPGLKARGYDRVHDELEAAFYSCWPLVVGAWHAGANHKRNRVWIVAVDVNATKVQRSSITRRKSNRDRKVVWPTLEWARAGSNLGDVDGLPKGLAEKTLGAFSDAVVPVLPEIIARTMLEIVP